MRARSPVAVVAVAVLMLVGACGAPESTPTAGPSKSTRLPPVATVTPHPETDTPQPPSATPTTTETPVPTATSPQPTDTTLPLTATAVPPTVTSPAISPLDGQILFSVYPDGDIAVMNVDGGDRRLLLDERMTGDLMTDRFAAWQSGGNAVSYVVDDFERAEIWLMPVDGGAGQLLVAEVAPVTSHSWSPDGGRLAFVSADHAICVLDLADDTITRLTDEHLRDARDPDWSPDGSALAFSASDGRNQDIYVVSADGTGLARITSHSAPDKHPDWSPDGTKLVFSSNRRSLRFSDIHLLDLNLGTEEEGNQPTPLTAADTLEVRPDWSPEGSWIAYMSYELGAGHGMIYAVSADGGAPVQVTANNVYHSVRWRP